jgi:hypothetical protein
MSLPLSFASSLSEKFRETGLDFRYAGIVRPTGEECQPKLQMRNVADEIHTMPGDLFMPL